ncbi:MAG: hypothetical protein IJV69_06315 [Kiritimatiellae bacterium]|nr:hypothetical protein [Kiritimatiellia bacterium]
MIIPMKQLTLLCTANSRDKALDALRELGCVHVKLDVRDGEQIRRSAMVVAVAEQALRILDVAVKNGTFAFRPDANSPVSAYSFSELEVVAGQLVAPVDTETVNTTAEIITRLREEALAYALLLRRYEAFGDVNPETITALTTAGIQTTLFKASVSAELPTEGVFTFAVDAGFVYGAWLRSEPLPEGFELISLPEISTAEMRRRQNSAEMLATMLVARLASVADSLRQPLMVALQVALDNKTATEVAANLHDATEIAWLQGYLPARNVVDVLAKTTAEGWGVVVKDVDPDDPNVPVLLEPPKGFRSIGTLFKGLGILPGYTEGDCSVPFYLFFSLFFAMLVGDAGYGAVMLTGVLTAGWKLRKRETARPLLLILTVFCLSTILWGVLSGTYFGIAKDALPKCLSAIPTVDWLGSNDNIMFLCFFIGACHISLARLWNAVLLAPSIKMLGEIGWLGVTWSMFMIVCGIVVSWFAQPDWAWWLLGGSAGVILIPLIADIKNEGINIGMLPLNIISAMGDIISYVRLFAVGLASVKVAENFNSMALSLDLPLALRIIAVCAILLVGHGLNLAMGALSILVHAVRLNTLEFSNAKGITWSGQPYNPFKQPQQ